MSRFRFPILAILGFVAALGLGISLLPGDGTRASAQTITVYKTPWCGCCGDWIKHLQRDGFDVVAIERDDLAPVRQRYDVPDRLASCHTAEIDGYAIEGHVPAAEIRRLLNERPAAKGLSVPGMPMGSPGMEQGGQSHPYDVVLFGPSGDAVFAAYVGRFPQRDNEAK
jgi:hypothetical protein